MRQNADRQVRAIVGVQYAFDFAYQCGELFLVFGFLGVFTGDAYGLGDFMNERT